MATALIDTASSGDVTIAQCPATTGKWLRIQGYVLHASGADSVYFAAGTDANKLTGTYNFTSYDGVVTPVAEIGWFDLPANTHLIMNKAATIQVSGHVRYEVGG